METRLSVLWILSVLLISGCASRYQVYTLVEGSQAEQRSDNNSHHEQSEEKNEVSTKEDSIQIKRDVLVDTKTGTLYYFDSLEGSLRTVPGN